MLLTSSEQVDKLNSMCKCLMHCHIKVLMEQHDDVLNDVKFVNTDVLYTFLYIYICNFFTIYPYCTMHNLNLFIKQE